MLIISCPDCEVNLQIEDRASLPERICCPNCGRERNILDWNEISLAEIQQKLKEHLSRRQT